MRFTDGSFQNRTETEPNALTRGFSQNRTELEKSIPHIPNIGALVLANFYSRADFEIRF